MGATNMTLPLDLDDLRQSLVDKLVTVLYMYELEADPSKNSFMVNADKYDEKAYEKA